MTSSLRPANRVSAIFNGLAFLLTRRSATPLVYRTGNPPGRSVNRSRLDELPVISTAAEPTHLHYIDTLRGAAAIQVLFCHLALGFAPGTFFATPSSGTILGYLAATPLFFPIDGASAVCIFFAISGYVLTPLFIRSKASDAAHILARFIRLGVPALAGCAISAIAFQLFARYNQAAGLTSEWLGLAWRPLPDLWFVKDALVNGILIGFRGDTVAQWFGFGSSAAPLSNSYLGVLWTLSIEFYGSILVLILTRARSWTLLFIASLILSRTYLLCFVAGHAAARCGLGENRPLISWPKAAAIASVGVMICMTSHYWRPGALEAICAISPRILPPCPSMDNGYLMRVYGATIFTIAIMQCAPARAFLGHVRLRALGRLSFSLYLMHWPIIFGVGSFLLVELKSRIGLEFARAATIAACAVLAIVAATAFERVDQLALWASRAARRAKIPASDSVVRP